MYMSCSHSHTLTHTYFTQWHHLCCSEWFQFSQCDYFFYRIFCEYIMSMHFCILIYVYICVYIYVSLTHNTHWFHVYMCTKYYAYTNTDQHSFISSFVWLYICLCAMHCFYMQRFSVTSYYCACICIHNFTQIVVPVHILHLFCSMPVLIIVCTLHRCFHAYSHTHMKILFTYRHIKSIVTFVCVQYIASWMHLHVYILFVYFITCMCACLWYTQHR